MRIRTYIAVIIVVCLAGGYLIEAVIADQYGAVQETTAAHSRKALAINDYAHARENIAQLLVTVDLVLGADESYLSQGASRQSALLRTQLTGLRDSELVADVQSLDRIIAAIESIESFLAEAQALVPDAREQGLGQLLERYDAVSADLVSDSDDVLDAANSEFDDLQQRLALELERADRYRLLVLLAYAMIVGAAWWWANRSITRPLSRLGETASDSRRMEPWERIDRGPQEILSLDRRLAELTATLVHQAGHDPLTGLVNRRELERQLEHWWGSCADAQVLPRGVICYIDLDRFKSINDSCGHAAGDRLLQRVAHEFLLSVRETDVVARLGGDEFCVVLKDCSWAEAQSVAEKLRSSIEQMRYSVGPQVFRISASIGMAKVSGQETNGREIIDAADAACAVAKESGRNRVYEFTLDDSRLERRRNDLYWFGQLTAALEEDRFVLYKQRIRATDSGKERGERFEILLRLVDDDGRVVAAGQFIPVAEQYGLAMRLDQWVVQAVLDWLSSDPQARENCESCSINLSAEAISNPLFRKFVISALRDSGVPAGKICFEITESTAVSDLSAAVTFIGELRKSGVQFALDDFGSGQASFGYLRDLAVDYLKIDGSFVRNLLASEVDLATVKAFREISHAYRIKTVAEFVDSEAVLARLTELGIDYAQGYYVGRPEAVEVEAAKVGGTDGGNPRLGAEAAEPAEAAESAEAAGTAQAALAADASEDAGAAKTAEAGTAATG